MCSECIDGYLKLSDYFVNMIDENDKIAGCMDIVDLVSLFTNIICIVNQSEYFLDEFN